MPLLKKTIKVNGSFLGLFLPKHQPQCVLLGKFILTSAYHRVCSFLALVISIWNRVHFPQSLQELFLSQATFPELV